MNLSLFLDPSSIDIQGFFTTFGLKFQSVVRTLEQAKAIVTGSDFLTCMAGRWEESIRVRPRAIILDVLYYDSSAEAILRRMLSQAGYRVSSSACRHNLGEWSSVPSSKVTCMVRGSLSQRVVHLIRLPRPAVEVVLSRVYGTMPGTYLDGSGTVVSLFPHITFVERRCWVPKIKCLDTRVKLARKYVGWLCGTSDVGDGEVDEVGVGYRSVRDRYTWRVGFGQDGKVRGVSLPIWLR